MGTNWDIRCIDCGTDAGVSGNYDPIHQDEIQEILEHAAKFAALRGIGNDFVVTRIGVDVPFEWLAEHAGHRLRPVSEYGDVDGTCAKEFKCAHCGSRLGDCDKDVDHQDACGKRAPTTVRSVP